MNDQPPIFMVDPNVARILNELVTTAPVNSRLYLHGGALRNALYYKFFGEKFTQRDFDLILIGDKEPLVQNLIAKGFIFGKKNSELAVVMKKPKVQNPTEKHNDWVYLDIVIRHGVSIEEALKQKVNFTFNGSAIRIQDMNLFDWYDKVISLPGAQEDLRSKQIRVNVAYPINIYACIRFVSRGFKPPTPEELTMMINDVRQISDEKFEYNKQKVIEYVGSEERVLDIAKELGVNFNILDLQETRK